MYRKTILIFVILISMITPVHAEQTNAQLLEKFRVLIEKIFYKKCSASKTLGAINGFCDCYSIRSSDSFSESDLVYYAKKKTFSKAFMAKTKTNAQACLKQVRNQ